MELPPEYTPCQDKLPNHIVNSYLNRLKLNNLPTANYTSLCVLMNQHLREIPFENLDVLARHEIRTSTDALHQKLIINKRGGYCFELNRFFSMLLNTAGYKTRTMLARVHVNGNNMPKLTHQCTLVFLSENWWLADVGFGASITQPIVFAVDKVSETKHGQYQLVNHPLGMMLQHRQNNDWHDIYSISNHPPIESDLNLGNYYSYNHPKATFRNRLLISKLTDKGYKTIADDKLHLPEGTIKKINNRKELETILKDSFGIEIKDTSFLKFLFEPRP